MNDKTSSSYGRVDSNPFKAYEQSSHGPIGSHWGVQGTWMTIASRFNYPTDPFRALISPKTKDSHSGHMNQERFLNRIFPIQGLWAKLSWIHILEVNSHSGHMNASYFGINPWATSIINYIIVGKQRAYANCGQTPRPWHMSGKGSLMVGVCTAVRSPEWPL